MREPATIDYDAISGRYDEHRRWQAGLPRALLRLAGLGAPGLGRGRILDVGCGTGNLSEWLEKEWPGELVGVDLSRGMLRRARAKVPRARLVRADAGRLPFRPASFSAVVGSFFLHHLDAEGRARLFGQARRMLAPPAGSGQTGGGRFVFVTASHSQIRGSCWTRWFPSLCAIDCVRFPDLPVLRAELGTAGFDWCGEEVFSRPEPRGDAALLEKVRARFISTFELLAAEEFQAGLARMEEELRTRGHLGDTSWQATLLFGGC